MDGTLVYETETRYTYIPVPDIAAGTYYIGIKACDEIEEICGDWSVQEVTIVGDEPAPSGFLAAYPGAAGAYSLRDLTGDGGAVVRAYRVADTTEQDFTAAEITDGTLATFANGGDVRVETLYDQSGNGRDLPRTYGNALIVASGAVNLSNGKPFIAFPSLKATFHATESGPLLEDLTLLCVHQSAWTTERRCFGLSGISGTGVARDSFAFSDDHSLRFDGAFTPGSLLASTGNKIRIATKNSDVVTDHINSVQNINTSVTGLVTEGKISLGDANTTYSLTTGFEGKIFEAIIWYSDLSVDRAQMTADINNYYEFY